MDSGFGNESEIENSTEMDRESIYSGSDLLRCVCYTHIKYFMCTHFYL